MICCNAAAVWCSNIRPTCLVQNLFARYRGRSLSANEVRRLTPERVIPASRPCSNSRMRWAFGWSLRWPSSPDRSWGRVSDPVGFFRAPARQRHISVPPHRSPPPEV